MLSDAELVQLDEFLFKAELTGPDAPSFYLSVGKLAKIAIADPPNGPLVKLSHNRPPPKDSKYVIKVQEYRRDLIGGCSSVAENANPFEHFSYLDS